jgi:putative IMPACT (imprinted ancient) family translation regulator
MGGKFVNKLIEKATLKIVQRMEQNRKEFVEAEASYRDTGYNKYYNKMNRLDVEYKELKDFMHLGETTEVLPQTIVELDRLREVVKNIKSKVFFMEADFPVNSHLVGLKELLKDI